MQPPVLSALVARSGKPIYSAAEEITLVTRGLVLLSSYFASGSAQPELLNPLRKFARRNTSSLTPLLSDAEVVTTSESDHGRRAALILQSLPASQNSAVSAALREWAPVAQSAFRVAAWSPSDLYVVLAELRRRGACDGALLAAVVPYLHAKASTASAADTVQLVAMATLLPEIYNNPDTTMLDLLMGRLAGVAEELSPSMAGTVCRCLNRAQLRDGTVALALQEEADRIAQACDTRTAVEFLLFISRQEAKFVSADSVQWLMERVMGEALDPTALLHLCRALRALPLPLKEQLRSDLEEMLAFIGSQMQLILEHGAAQRSPDHLASTSSFSLHSESTQVLLASFLKLHRVLVPTAPTDSPMLQPYLAAVSACASFIAERLDDLIDGVTGLSYSIPYALLEAPTETAHRCGIYILREYMRECVHLPAMQTFQFLLLLGDADVRDGHVLRYLRGCFCKTADGIPPAQLCTALRCFAACDPSRLEIPDTSPSDGAANAGDNVEVAREREDSAAFLRFAVELARKCFGDGLPLRLALALVEALYGLGCRDEVFYEHAAAFLEARRATATAQAHSAETATAVCLALGEDILDKYPDLHSFLLSVEKLGTRGEAQLSPSAWMDLHDPANAIAPLTEQQQASWYILDRMRATRADDRDALIALGDAYLKLLPHVRPDDIKFFFSICEDKALKEDRLLRECLAQLVAVNITPRLSGATIASILHSLAALRFAYPRATRRFLEAISEEQWREMNAAPLVQILSALSRLSLRMPHQLGIIGQRVQSLSCFLTPRDIAEAIRALQSLGHQDVAVAQALIASAAARASGFDDVSLTTLFAAPSVHRLLRTAEVALPLLRRACGVVSSPVTRQRIAARIRRSGASRELLESCTAELRMLSGPGAAETLRLT